MDALSRQASASVNSIIFSELCYQNTTVDEVDHLLDHLDLRFAELPKEALFLAAQAFRIYRKRGGSKTAPLPDFLIGAHAAAAGIPILTRDVGRFQTCFPTVQLFSP